MTELRERMLDDMHIRNFSPHTQRCYIRHVQGFAEHFKTPSSTDRHTVNRCEPS